MDEAAEMYACLRQFEILVRWLASKDPKKNQVAAANLVRLGRKGMEALVEEAIAPGRRPDHRVAILDVVARIGEPLGPTEFFKLRSLLRHRVPRVQEKAAAVFMVLTPCGPPNSPAAAALMQVFHPAFWTPPRRRQKFSPLRAYKKYCLERAKARRLGG